MSRVANVTIAIGALCVASSLYVHAGGTCSQGARSAKKVDKKQAELRRESDPSRIGLARLGDGPALRHLDPWIRVSAQQRAQVLTCNRATDRVRTLARNLGKAAKGSRSNAAAVRRRHERLNETIVELQKEHGDFAAGLVGEPKAKLKDRIEQMGRSADQMNLYLAEMAKNLASDAPDTRLVSDRARKLEQEAKNWRKHYRSIMRNMVETEETVIVQK